MKPTRVAVTEVRADYTIQRVGELVTPYVVVEMQRQPHTRIEYVCAREHAPQVGDEFIVTIEPA